ncbi:MAG: hypothetical protein HDT13_08395 [Butyrivibrio sp.]|nr:hypothetical protein [Butyrivibrio sp.]
MKNHYDVTNNVFRRRDEYNAAQRRRKKNAIKAGSFIACLCLAAAAGFGVFKSGLLQNTDAKPDNTQTDASNGRQSVIKINKIEGGAPASASPDIYIAPEDFIEFSRQEAVEYYGANIFPELPADLNEASGRNGIYRKNNGIGEIYYSTFTLNYRSSDSNRSVEVKGDKGHKPLSCIVVVFEEPLEPTLINGENVFFTDFGDGNIYTEFSYNNVFFEINFHGLSEEEIFNAVSSLIK